MISPLWVLAGIAAGYLILKFLRALIHFFFYEFENIWWQVLYFSRLERCGFIYMVLVAFFMDTTRQPGYEFWYWNNRTLLLTVIFPVYYAIPWVIAGVRLLTVSISYYMSKRYYTDLVFEPSKVFIEGVIAWCGVHADSKLTFEQVRRPVKIISFFFDSMDYRAGLYNRPVKADMDMKESLDDFVYREIYS